MQLRELITTAINIRMEPAGPRYRSASPGSCTSVLVLSVDSATYIMENRVRIPVTMNQNTSTGRPASLAEYAVPRHPEPIPQPTTEKTTSA